MRIPLDYYRILGLPIQATAEQLKQSHRDRALQVPRREYSELAIDARKQLIDKAYEVLGNSARRAEYDQEFLAKTKAVNGASESLESTDDPASPDANVPTIEMENHLLVGALLVLLELGEYELVLRLGRPYIKRDPNTPEGQQLKEQPALSDIILTLAVACLELGREEWQQNHYEHAAESLGTGRELLLKEELFPVLRAEIQADLYKLRPYRALELIARPLDQQSSRQEGVNLLRGMLQDRGGIDGADDDLSGLGVDDFLRFVQQLRGYLTAAEQQEVFEAEAQRPSAVGTYLAVYALLARGFAQHQPALIRRAKQMLLRLSGRQDVHLEQAVCAVLLGQTEEASRALELSQEEEPLTFIREHSQGSPDLLPGLCLYAENWLQQEVFPFFRDLDQEPATLKDYFADSTVQSYLENLPLENERKNRQSVSAQQSGVGDSQTVGAGYAAAAGSTAVGSMAVGSTAAATSLQPSTFGTPSTFSPPALGSQLDSSRMAMAGAAGAAGFAGGASIVDKISKMSPAGQLSGNSATELSGGGAKGGLSGLRERRNRRNGTSPKWDRIALLILAGIVSVGIGLFLAGKVWGWLSGGSSTSTPAIEGEPLDLSLNEPPIEIESTGGAADIPADDAMGIAEATVNSWLETKTAAYAEGGDVGELNDVLTGTVLSDAQRILRSLQDSGGYVDYSHGSVRILSVDPENAEDADRLTVSAEVTESATAYDQDGVDNAYSYSNDVVVATYELVQEDGQWLIEDIRQ
ncbi:MAG: IMS domain-containing protein [Cyanobacteria bacterium J06560_6]